MKASIIIPTYNRSQSLKRVLDSIFQADFPQTGFEVVIVDNNSNDETPSVAKQYQTRGLNITYVKEERLSFTVARHTGARAARTDLLCYLDDDVVVDRKWLSTIVRLFGSDGQVGMVAGRIEPLFEQPPPEWALCLQKRFNGWSLWHPSEKEGECSGACGPSLSVRKSLLEKLGGFPPDTIGGESKMKPGTVEKIYIGPGDWGLSLKVKKAGYRIMYSPEALVYHVIPPVRMTHEWWQSRLVGEGYMKALTEQVWGKLPRIMIGTKSVLDSCYGLTALTIALFCRLFHRKEQWLFQYVADYAFTKARVERRLVSDPGLARYLWDLALEGIQPNEIDDLRKKIP